MTGSESSNKKSISNIRKYIWPIYGAEHKIWLPMAVMVGLILFNYTVARNLKDSLVITATKSSEIIPFIKSIFILPVSILFFVIYAKLGTIFHRRTLFYIIVSLFIAFFAVFALVLFPMKESIHPEVLVISYH